MRDAKKAVILTYDAVSPLGTDFQEQWQRAVRGESGIGRLNRFPLEENFPVRIAGQVPECDFKPYAFLSPRALALWPSPVFPHAMLVVHRMLEKSGIDITGKLAPRTAITFSSAVGGLDAVLSADRRMIAEKKLSPPYTNPNSCINMVGGKISILTGATGPITSAITACATGLSSVIVGAMLLEQGRADLVICGAVDFPLVEPIVAGFATMNGACRFRPGKSGRAAEVPAHASRPFSLERRGFVISEGAGGILIATKEFAESHGLPYAVEIAGWSMTSDARHFVAPNYETVKRCMSEAVADAGITPREIDAVNAHATSTKIGDKIEYDALRAVFGKHMPPVSANKSMTGHAMGASSALEVILAVEGMQREILLPTINYTPDPEMEIDCVAEGSRNLFQEYVLKNAFGFGGCNCCIVLRRKY